MYHYLGGNVGELLGVLACDIRVRARVTGSGIVVAKLLASAGSVLVDELDALPDRSWQVGSGVEVAAAPVNKADDGCARLTFGSCLEVPAPVFECFATIFSFTAGLCVVCSVVETGTAEVSQFVAGTK